MIVGVYNSFNDFRTERKVEKTSKASSNKRNDSKNIVIDIEYEEVAQESSAVELARIIVKGNIFVYDKKGNLVNLNQRQRILAIA